MSRGGGLPRRGRGGETRGPSGRPGPRVRLIPRASLLSLLPLLALAACSGTMIPPPSAPPAVPAAFREAPPGWKTATPADTLPRGDWWRAFGDPALDELMPRLAAANLDLRAAEARWRQASALGRQARAALWPTLSASAGASRSRSAAEGATTTLSAGVGADWELDLWGRLRSGVAVQQANIAATAADVANTRLSLQAELATDVLALRVVDAQRALLDAGVAAYENSLQLTRNRYAAGVVSRADVAQAETQWYAAQTQLTDLDISRAQLEHAVAVLVGQAPAELALPGRDAGADASLGLTLPAVPPVLPSTLLERRPDVAAAARDVDAARANLGVLRAALFPTLGLSASAGTRGSTLADLFSLPNRVWSIGPSLAATLFDAGQRRAEVEQGEARLDELVATWRQSVLVAMRDVEDQLVTLSVLEREARLQEQTVRAAGESLALVLNQYRAGTVPYLNVITAQTADQSARRAALDLTGRRLAATVSLIRALGGGWSPEDPPVAGP